MFLARQLVDDYRKGMNDVSANKGVVLVASHFC